MTADERIAGLIRREYLEQMPSFLRKHALENSCYLIARDYPERYAAFSGEEEPDNETTRQMSALVNGIFLERLNRRRPI